MSTYLRFSKASRNYLGLGPVSFNTDSSSLSVFGLIRFPSLINGINPVFECVSYETNTTGSVPERILRLSGDYNSGTGAVVLRLTESGPHGEAVVASMREIHSGVSYGPDALLFDPSALVACCFGRQIFCQRGARARGFSQEPLFRARCFINIPVSWAFYRPRLLLGLLLVRVCIIPADLLSSHFLFPNSSGIISESSFRRRILV